ncbi:MAG: hypothetical protein J6K53_11020 [Roseburia sp.]|nr:hypothetical protein [Roseburia sp.]
MRIVFGEKKIRGLSKICSTVGLICGLFLLTGCGNVIGDTVEYYSSQYPTCSGTVTEVGEDYFILTLMEDEPLLEYGDEVLIKVTDMNNDSAEGTYVDMQYTVAYSGVYEGDPTYIKAKACWLYGMSGD